MAGTLYTKGHAIHCIKLYCFSDSMIINFPSLKYEINSINCNFTIAAITFLLLKQVNHINDQVDGIDKSYFTLGKF